MCVAPRLCDLKVELLVDLEKHRLLMNNQELFTSTELKENEARKRELIELVASGEAILIVGAGSSKGVEYPDWPELLKRLEQLAKKYGDGFKQDEGKRENHPLEYAEDIKSHICKETGNLDRYYALLQELFGPKNPPFKDFHRKLALLPFRGILTTNYDTVLEAALGNIEPVSAYDNSLVIDQSSVARVHEFLMAMNNDKRMTRRIAHLHGRFDISDRLILSIEDYRRAYRLNLTDGKNSEDYESELRFKLLWAVLATRRVVFVGFSMNDPYLNKILQAVSNDLWRWDKSIHYTIMKISRRSADESKERAKWLKREHGVGTVFYEDFDEEDFDENLDDLHQGLEHIVAEMVECSGVESQPLIDERDWLEQINQRMDRKLDDEN